MKRNVCIYIILFFIVIFLPADIPKTLSYQGMLSNNDGTYVDDGLYDLKFKLYNVLENGTSLWEEQHIGVDVNNGIFNVTLGSNTALNLSFDQQYWLGISIDDNTELIPRLELTASSYAFSAINSTNSDSLNNQQPDYYLDWNNFQNIPLELLDGDDVGEGSAIYSCVVDINGNGDYGNIIDAIDSLDENTTIFIRNGIYNLSGNVNLKEGQELLGENRNGVIIQSSSNSFVSSYDGISIRNVTLFNTGIQLGDDSIVSYCIVTSASESWISVEQHSNVAYNYTENINFYLGSNSNLVGNHITGLSNSINMNGFAFYNQITNCNTDYAIWNPRVCIGNYIEGSGIKLTGATGGIRNISNNSINSPPAHGIYIQGSIASNAVQTIQGNSIKGSGASGVFIEGSSSSSNSTISINNNNIYNSNEYGICNNQHVATISNNVINNYDSGILNNGDHSIILGNIIVSGGPNKIQNNGSNCIVEHNTQ